MAQNVLATGGAGYIGSHTVLQLLHGGRVMAIYASTWGSRGRSEVTQYEEGELERPRWAGETPLSRPYGHLLARIFSQFDCIDLLRCSLVCKVFLKKKIKPYIPDFKLAFELFCIHAGGRAVLDELEKNLKLSPWHMEPSRMTLYRFGNTSSSSLWYELAYSEAKGRIKRGDRTWQMAFGSGFMCNCAVWKAIRTINPAKEKNPWMDEIDNFPVTIPNFSTIGDS